jgi:hypothetical protein
MPKIERSLSGLRHALFDEIDAMKSGRENYEQARAVVQAASQINATIHAEYKVRKMIESSPDSNSGLKKLVK